MVRHASVILGVLALVAGACESAAQPVASGGSDGAASGGAVGTGGAVETGGSVGTGGLAGVVPDSSAAGAPEDAGAISVPDGPLGAGPDAVVTSDVASSFGRQACARGCTTAAPLHCPQSATCISNCQSDYDKFVTQTPQCRPFIDTLLACGALRPITDWECDTDGKEVLKEGICQMEGERAIQCILGS